MSIETLTALAPKIWTIVDRQEQFPWPATDAARASLIRSLSEILPPDHVSRALNGATREQTNRSLRELVAPLLRSDDRLLATRLAKWIVRDWGGIKAGAQSGAVEEWSERLGAYSQGEVSVFVSTQRNRRISSWSKVVAFANPQRDAIYDSRTAVALNCALDQLGYDGRFHVPLSQNRLIANARKRLRKRYIGRPISYGEYLALLNEFVRIGLCADILAGEMVLFSNAPTIAADFLGKT